jgi:hypothetical protein
LNQTEKKNDSWEKVVVVTIYITTYCYCLRGATASTA